MVGFGQRVVKLNDTKIYMRSVFRILHEHECTVMWGEEGRNIMLKQAN